MNGNKYWAITLLLSLIICGMGLDVCAQTEDSMKSNQSLVLDSLHTLETIQKDSSAHIVEAFQIIPVVDAIDSLALVVEDLSRELKALKKIKTQVMIERVHDTVFVMADSMLVRTPSIQSEQIDSINEQIIKLTASLEHNLGENHDMQNSIKFGVWLLAVFFLVVSGLLIWWLQKDSRDRKSSINVILDKIGNDGRDNPDMSRLVGEMKMSLDEMPDRFVELQKTIVGIGESNVDISAKVSEINVSMEEVQGKITEIKDYIGGIHWGGTDDTTNNASESEQNLAKENNDKQIKPTLEAYNHSVNEFRTINDHINSLRRRETRILLHYMYRFLAMQNTDASQLLQQIRETNISDNEKEQFVSLVSQIQAFLVKKKPIIDLWLSFESKDEVHDYLSGLRLPIGQSFDENLDRDILGDDLTGQTINVVHKMGFYFPGNTIAPYRELSIVSI